MPTFGEPATTDDLRGLLLDYLDYYREVVIAKLDGMDHAALTSSRLPSGWTPIGLLNHLVHMERRWLRWGFLAEQVDQPWGDSADGGGWAVPQDDLATLVEHLRAAGRRTRQIVQTHPLDARATTGGRFDEGSEPPQLHWILLHVLQEYARHAGHLDIARELADGSTGEEG